MRKGRLFILHEEVTQQKKPGVKPVKKRKAKTAVSPNVVIEASYQDNLGPISLSFDSKEIPIVQSHDYNRKPSDKVEAYTIEVNDLKSGLSDIMDDEFQEQIEGFFSEGAQLTPEVNAEKEEIRENRSNPDSEVRKSPEAQKNAEPELNPVDYSHPHHLFDQISNNIAKTKAISLGEFSLQHSTESIENKKPIINENDIDEDLKHLNQ